MKHVTQKLIEVNGTPVDIKARLEKGAWVVIAFTPVFSIRSHKLHLPKARDNFITAIVSAAMDEDDPEYADNRDAIQRRGGSFELPQSLAKATRMIAEKNESELVAENRRLKILVEHYETLLFKGGK
jgi:hypothetical protein